MHSRPLTTLCVSITATRAPKMNRDVMQFLNWVRWRDGSGQVFYFFFVRFFFIIWSAAAAHATHTDESDRRRYKVNRSPWCFDGLPTFAVLQITINLKYAARKLFAMVHGSVVIFLPAEIPILFRVLIFSSRKGSENDSEKNETNRSKGILTPNLFGCGTFGVHIRIWNMRTKISICQYS